MPGSKGDPDLLISFDDVDLAEANQLAGELQYDLESQVEGVGVNLVRGKARTMDFGATLAIMLGSAAATAVAKGIQAWLAKRDSATVTIKTRTGEIIATGVSAGDARDLVEKALSNVSPRTRRR